MKIMFICTGNVCRSAMAHGLMEKKITDRNLQDIEIYSCGVFADNGERATYEAQEVMEEYGVDLKNHRATNIAYSDIESMDLILCATKSHKMSVIQKYPSLKEKVYTMNEYAGVEHIEMDIKDPWGGGIEVYRFSAAEIESCVDKIIEKIK